MYTVMCVVYFQIHVEYMLAIHNYHILILQLYQTRLFYVLMLRFDFVFEVSISPDSCLAPGDSWPLYRQRQRYSLL